MIHKVLHRIILASQSSPRATLLKSAGVDFETCPAYLDESIIKRDCQENGKTAGDAALALAIAKTEAIDVSEAFVIGADQILMCDGRWFDKATSLEEAYEHLTFLQGKVHELPSAACVRYQGNIVWQTVQTPRLKMRSMTSTEIKSYLHEAGSDVLSSIGCYKLELMGKRLFSEIEGDRATIIGLPLKELLIFLETEGIHPQKQSAFESAEVWDSAFTISTSSL